MAHIPVDVQELGVDFYAFSGHKLFGPTGTGVLWGRADLLNGMPPWQGGGDMIDLVTFEKTTYNKLPHKFEAGTPNIAGVIGLGEAIRWFRGLGLDAVRAHEEEVFDYATERMNAVPGLRIIGTAADKTSVISFLLGSLHPHDVGTLLDEQGIAVRTGHHCTQPLMARFGITATVRASFSVYNDKNDVDRLIDGLEKARRIFGEN